MDSSARVDDAGIDADDVELTVAQHGDERVDGKLAHRQLDFRVAVLEAAEHLRQFAQDGGDREADGEAAGFAAHGASHRVLRAIELLQGQAGLVIERAARRRQRDVVMAAHQQLGAEFVLDLADVLAQGRLRDMQRLCRLGEVHLVHQRDEILEMTNFDHALRPRRCETLARRSR